MINTVSYSYSAHCYPDILEEMIALIEGTTGVGAAFGPVMGSFAYEIVGYSWTWYIFGILIIPTVFLSLYLKSEQEMHEMREKNAKVEADANDAGWAEGPDEAQTLE